jgi:NTP pyrophosphatase (non-canonical NTP hydrolase)
MELNDYQELAVDMKLPTADMDYLLLGLVGEVGEFYSPIAKAIRDDTDIEDNLLKKELGDILWFIATISAELGLTLNEIAEANIKKLQSRKLRGTIGGSGNDR